MTTEQMDEVDAMKAAAEPEPTGVVTEEISADTPTVKRPKPQDRKEKKAKRPKVKVKLAMGKNEAGLDVPIGRIVTLHGVTVTVLDSALGDFETVDDLSLLGEAFEASERTGGEANEELLQAAFNRVSPLLRRLVGYKGSREVLTALRYEGGGKVEFEDAMGFISDLMAAMRPNS
jgi:hypothetical protein